MEVVASEVTSDGQRVVETLEDGSTATRPPSVAEQVGALEQEILGYVVRMVPQALSGSIVVDSDRAGGMAVLTISLSGTARALPVDTPDDLPTIDSTPDGKSLHAHEERKAKAGAHRDEAVEKAEKKPTTVKEQINQAAKKVQTRSGTRSA